MVLFTSLEFPTRGIFHVDSKWFTYHIYSTSHLIALEREKIRLLKKENEANLRTCEMNFISEAENMQVNLITAH